jgi:drug/metabolite transporter (DMT)-like permease
VLTVALLGPLGYILVLSAMKLAPIGHVAPMRELGTLIGTWFGARLLKEGVTPARMTGAALVVGGVIALALAG